MWAITLQPPWSYAVTDLGKDIENRKWPAPQHLLEDKAGGWLFIHAGKTWNEAALTWLVDQGFEVPPPSRIPHSAIVGAVRISGCYEVPRDRPRMSRWEIPGFYAWQMTDHQKLFRPVPCGGQQGLWRIPPPVQRLVRERFPAELP